MDLEAFEEGDGSAARSQSRRGQGLCRDRGRSLAVDGETEFVGYEATRSSAWVVSMLLTVEAPVDTLPHRGQEGDGRP